MNDIELEQQNRRFKHSGGVSQNNRHQRFVPAFKNTETDEVVISKFGNGLAAPIHIIEGLPDTWATERTADGRIVCVSPCVIAGFIKDEHFYTRAQAAKLVAA